MRSNEQFVVLITLGVFSAILSVIFSATIINRLTKISAALDGSRR
jgi:hypothetical protein